MIKRGHAQRQNAHLTYKANTGAGRHGWLRLTPAYSVRLVRELVEGLPAEAVVTDPFSGTGTTPLAAVEHGCVGQSLDVNPFLIWLGNVKIRHYDRDVLDEVRRELPRLADGAHESIHEADELWAPRLHNIERWWSGGALAGLKGLRRVLDESPLPRDGLDLLGIAFCRVVIGTSNASFDHQSMSFKGAMSTRSGSVDAVQAVQRFVEEAEEILDGAAADLPGSGKVVLGDSRSMEDPALRPCDLLLTSPPYVNRMSYIRELRPYMYWLRFLDRARDAGELDWQAIGGTWGIATSRLNGWVPDGRTLPIDAEMREVRALIERDGGKNGPLLSTYTAKYFHDMFAHFEVAFKHVKSGGRAVYIIGNSAFYGHVVAAERWYATMMREVGFTDVTITTIRKRNSNKALYEYEVAGRRP